MQRRTRYTIERIGGYLHKVIPIVDGTGRVVSHVIQPLMVELRRRDIMQIIIGASILAIPVGFTEEVWDLGERLPVENVLALIGVSVLFISMFVYFNFYRFHLKTHAFDYAKRVLATYALSLVVVGVLLTIIQVTPWGVDNVLAMKRVIIVAFPASMSAAVSDMLK